jgi:putative membrane protein
MRVMMLLLAGGLAFAQIPKKDEVQVKNAPQANAAKSDLTVPERKFVEEAASDDIATIEMSRLALDKSTNKATRMRAQTLIAERQQSLDQLKRIANDQSFPLPTSATTSAQEEFKNLAKLDGEKFDREYGKQMDKRHDAAVQTFQKADLQHPDLKSYAEKTLRELKTP